MSSAAAAAVCGLRHYTSVVCLCLCSLSSPYPSPPTVNSSLCSLPSLPEKWPLKFQLGSLEECSKLQCTSLFPKMRCRNNIAVYEFHNWQKIGELLWLVYTILYICQLLVDMRCSDAIDVITITRRHVGGTLSVIKKRSKMRKSENILCQCYLQTDWLIIPHTTVTKPMQIYSVTLLQEEYLQHGGNCCSKSDVTVTPFIAMREMLASAKTNYFIFWNWFTKCNGVKLHSFVFYGIWEISELALHY